MKKGPVQLIIEGDECLVCCMCMRYLKNTVAFIRTRIVKDIPRNQKYAIGVVYCGKCEVEASADEKEAVADDNGI